MCLVLMERAHTVPGMHRQLVAETQTNADQTVMLFNDKGYDGGFTFADPDKMQAAFMRSRILFMFMNKRRFLDLKGFALAADWFERYKGLMHRFHTQVNLGLTVKDYLLPNDHWYVLQERQVAISRSAIPMKDRRENKRARTQGARAAQDQSEDDDDMGDTEEDMEEMAKLALAKKGRGAPKRTKPAWGKGWLLKMITMCAKGDIKKDGGGWYGYKFEHPKHNPMRAQYDGCPWFNSLSWRYQAIILHFDLVQPVRPESIEEFIPLCRLPVDSVSH